MSVETFAVALLWCFRNPTHERRVGEILREMRPDAYVSLSSEIAPMIGEYERTATTALNSYLAPKVVNYLNRMEGRLQESGFKGSFHILNSSGGVMPAKEAARKPVLLLTSGPTGGVLGSLQLANALGHSNVITTDMGGTRFDVVHRRRPTRRLGRRGGRRLSFEHANDRHPRHWGRRRLDCAR